MNFSVDVDISIRELFLEMDEKDRLEITKLLTGVDTEWLLAQVEIECRDQTLPPYTRQYLELVSGKQVGLV